MDPLIKKSQRDSFIDKTQEGFLIKALDNENNDDIMNFTTKKIEEMNLKILKELCLKKQTMTEYFKKLKGYKYVDELGEIKCGSFIKWIPITDPDYLPLNNCGIICSIKDLGEGRDDEGGVVITCKNFMHRHYTFKMDECLIFRKLTNQEKIILCALDHLEKNKDTIEEDSEEDEEED